MPTTIAQIKEKMEDQIGSKITLVAQTGRKRQTEHTGILSELYPAVFVVDLEDADHSFDRVSYSYTDILTHTVEVEFL